MKNAHYRETREILSDFRLISMHFVAFLFLFYCFCAAPLLPLHSCLKTNPTQMLMLVHWRSALFALISDDYWVMIDELMKMQYNTQK